MPQSGFPSGTWISCFIDINYSTGFAVLDESGTWKEYASSLKVPYALSGIKAVGDNIIAFGNMFYSSETIIGCALRFNTTSQTFTSGSLWFHQNRVLINCQRNWSWSSAHDKWSYARNPIGAPSFSRFIHHLWRILWNGGQSKSVSARSCSVQSIDIFLFIYWIGQLPFR